MIQRRAANRSTAPLAALFALALAACGNKGGGASASAEPAGGGSVKDQCAALNKVNDEWSKKLENQKDTDDPAKDAQTMIQNVDGWSAAVGKLSISDSGLKKLATDEQDILKNMSSSLKELTGILAKLDDKKAPNMDEKAIDALQKQMDAIEKKQETAQKSADAMDDKIAKYCEGK
jgi:hypothetical protein